MSWRTMTIVDEINAKVSVAREHVNRGQYTSASHNFEEVLYLVDRCASSSTKA